jgi:hypothetical protein
MPDATAVLPANVPPDVLPNRSCRVRLEGTEALHRGKPELRNLMCPVKRLHSIVAHSCASWTAECHVHGRHCFGDLACLPVANVVAKVCQRLGNCEIQTCPSEVRHGWVPGQGAENPFMPGCRNSNPSGIGTHSDLECAVNVPYGHNPPSTYGFFCNPDDTFRASVIYGQSVDLHRREINFGDSRLLTTNQKAGSSNLSGRAS